MYYCVEFIVGPYPSITFRTIGGILDMFFFTGVGDRGNTATPAQIVAQYWGLVNTESGIQMPPYWALGFHLCRYNYNSDMNLFATINRTIAGRFPYVFLFHLFVYFSDCPLTSIVYS